MRVHEVDVHPALPERLGWLGEIARNVWTSWNPEAQELFARHACSLGVDGSVDGGTPNCGVIVQTIDTTQRFSSQSR